MIEDFLVILLIFGSLLYFDNISKYIIVLLLLYFLFIVYKQKRTTIYDSVNDIVKSDKLSEYIESNDEIIDISKYKKYDKRSYLNGLKKFKKINKYLNKLDKDNYIKKNKNIINNCYYYLDESVKNFKAINNSINIEQQNSYLEKVKIYDKKMKEKIDKSKYEYGLMYEYDTII